MMPRPLPLWPHLIKTQLLPLLLLMKPCAPLDDDLAKSSKWNLCECRRELLLVVVLLATVALALGIGLGGL